MASLKNPGAFGGSTGVCVTQVGQLSIRNEARQLHCYKSFNTAAVGGPWRELHG